MDFIAKHGKSAWLKTVPDDKPPGSDVAKSFHNGIRPRRYYTGRGPLEAASIGIGLTEDDIALGATLITEKDGLLADYSSGHITSEEARILSKLWICNWNHADSMAGVSYRHLLS